MKNEELLEKAKQDYPIGTLYKPLTCRGHRYSNTYTSTRIPKFSNEGKNPDDSRLDCGPGYCYAEGIWAEVVSRPEVKSEVINTYEIY